MQAFYDNARVQVSKNGLYFYEQDIIMSKYLFSRDLKIDLNLIYQRSGFGIVLVEDTGRTPFESTHTYLFHCGTNTYHSSERHLGIQTDLSPRSNVLAPAIDEEVHLEFQYTAALHRMKLYMYINEDGVDRPMEIGSHIFNRKFKTYYIGFYSVAGNTIKDCTFLQGIPNHWDISIANVHGGRISFWDDGFQFEDCIHDAELEQNVVTLEPGKYYLTYDTAPINDKFDIECTIYDADISIPKGEVSVDEKASDALANLSDQESEYYRKRGRLDEKYLEDHGKNILKEDGTFELSHDTNIVVSFKGMNGAISNVGIKDNPFSEFVATGDTMKKTDGSWIEVDLTNVTNVRWEGIIYKVPEYTDFSLDCPYGIIATKETRVMLDALSIDLGEEYAYSYDVASSILTSHVLSTQAYQGQEQIIVTADDYNRIKLFMNIKATINNLILTMEDGTEVNINVQKEFHAFVPGYIKGPIIVTDDSNVSFELSASYREVVKEDLYAIDYFPKNAIEMKLTYHTANINSVHEVYGISEGATINPKEQTDISKFTTNYTPIQGRYVKLHNDILTMPAAVIDDYEYIAIKYQRADQFKYKFVTTERETFDGTENLLALEGTLNTSGQGVTIYGVTAEGNYQPQYLFRVPNADMEESIDLCADDYDIISSTLYTIDAEEGTIKLDKSLNDLYQVYIVDYTKQDSYAVNWNEEYEQYEVDVTSDKTVIRIHYEFDDNRRSSNKIRTEILSNENKFVILRRQKGVFLDED